jgi:hypothetical protein
MWMAKGLPRDEAIAWHMSQMTRSVNGSVALTQSGAGHKIVVEAFFA